MPRFFSLALLISLSFSSAEARDTMPVVVVQGGFRSCREIKQTDKLPIGTKQNDVFQEFKDRIEKELGSPLHWVLGCMAGDRLALKPPWNLFRAQTLIRSGEGFSKRPMKIRYRNFARGSKPKCPSPIPSRFT